MSLIYTYITRPYQALVLPNRPLGTFNLDLYQTVSHLLAPILATLQSAYGSEVIKFYHH
jgi:hypothetical protein